MLYDLSSQATGAFLKAWNTCVKLTWDVSRSTFTYIVENVLAANFVSLRHQAYARYVSFFQGMFKSSSKEVRHLVRIVARDVRSVTSRNVKLIESVSGLSPWDYSKWRIKEKLTKTNNEWRVGLLVKLLTLRQNKQASFEDTTQVDGMIDSLCCT